MTEDEHYLACLAEECDEVGQRTMKALRFGLTERQPIHMLDNAGRIVDELHDLIAVAVLLRRRGLISNPYPTEERILMKQAKIEKNMAISREQGVLT